MSEFDIFVTYVILSEKKDLKIINQMLVIIISHDASVVVCVMVPSCILSLRNKKL